VVVFNRWYPHLDYAGEPMERGQFRDPQPTDEREVHLRNAAILALERFALMEGFDLQPLTEEIADCYGGDDKSVRRVSFTGEHNGKRFRMGYEVTHGDER
jgi:hypothetical protein